MLPEDQGAMETVTLCTGVVRGAAVDHSLPRHHVQQSSESGIGRAH